MSRSKVLNEIGEVEKILENGFFSDSINSYDLHLLAKYFFGLGLDNAEIKEKLISFCKKEDQYFSPVIYRKLIKKAISDARKFSLRDGNVDVIITQKEIDIIKKLDLNLSKILFVMLVLAKFDKQNPTKIKKKESKEYYCNYSYEEIFRIAKISINPDEIDLIKYTLDGDLGYVSATTMGEENWKILIVDNDSETCLTVNDLQNIISFFPYFCSKCGNKIENISKHHSMCRKCYQEYRKEIIRTNSREYKRKNRSYTVN